MVACMFDTQKQFVAITAFFARYLVSVATACNDILKELWFCEDQCPKCTLLLFYISSQPKREPRE